MKQHQFFQHLCIIKTAAKLVINKLKTKLPVNTPTAVVILIPVLGLILLTKLIKASLRKSAELKESFIDHLASRPPILNTVKYNNIVNDDELSWQENIKDILMNRQDLFPEAKQRQLHIY